MNEENVKGATPLDLAATSEMKTLLKSFVGEPSKVRKSIKLHFSNKE